MADDHHLSTLGWALVAGDGQRLAIHGWVAGTDQPGGIVTAIDATVLVVAQDATTIVDPIDATSSVKATAG